MPHYYPLKSSRILPSPNGQFPLAALAFFARERRGLGGCPCHKTQYHPSQKSKLSHESRFRQMTNKKRAPASHLVLNFTPHFSKKQSKMAQGITSQSKCKYILGCHFSFPLSPGWTMQRNNRKLSSANGVHGA